jgi:ribonuclease HI
LLITPDGAELSSSLRLEFKTTNNEAEYEAVIAGLGLALELGAESVDMRSDSQVIVGHIRGEFEAKGKKMKMYLSKVHHMKSFFQEFYITKIPRDENEKVDRLARIASTENWDAEEDRENVRSLTHPSISDQVLESAVIEEVSDWRKELIDYLTNGVLSAEKKYAVQLKMRAGRFTMLNGALYRRGFTLPLLKCVSPEEGNYILREAHEGICGSHSGSRVLAHKAVRAGFYWPGMSKDSTAIVRNCEKCQRFTNVTKQPPTELSSISSPWPFSQ